MFAEGTAFSRLRVQRVFEEAATGATDAPKAPLAAALGRLLYLIHLAVLLWWLLDRTPRQRATTALVALAQQLLPSAALALRLPAIRRFVIGFDELMREGLFGSAALPEASMFLTRRPAPAAIDRFLRDSQDLPVLYGPIGRQGRARRPSVRRAGRRGRPGRRRFRAGQEPR